jgi:hypothetical protein
MPKSFRPVARTEDLLIEELDDELLVYDRSRDTGCRLNRTAAAVWRSADGTHSISDLVAVLEAEVGEMADEDLVLVTLDRLEDHGLIESGYDRRDAETTRLSRRRFIRRVGVVGAAALALPVVQSVVAPSLAAAFASSCDPCNCPCGCTSCDACGTCGCYCQPSGGCYCESETSALRSADTKGAAAAKWRESNLRRP